MKSFRKVLPGNALILGLLLSSPAAWATLSITAGGLPLGQVGTPYSTPLAATGGTPGYTWALTANVLPPGLTLSAAGLISGTPTAVGTYPFFVTVTDSASATALQSFSISIVPATVALQISTAATLPDAVVGASYTQALAATGGTPPYLWALASPTSALPDGIAFSSTGTLSGTPSTLGKSTFTVQVVDSALAAVVRTFSLTVDAPTAARSGVLPQVASGGGWKTSLYLVNTSTSITPVPVTVKFWSNAGAALTLPLTVTQPGGAQSTPTASSVSATIDRNSTLLIETNTGATVESEGWAEVISTGPITGYGIFHFTSSSGVESEGTVPLVATFVPSFILPYDATNKFLTGVALTALSTTTTTLVTATVWDQNGTQLDSQTITLFANGHKSFMLGDLFPSTISHRGAIEFRTGSVANGIAGLGLRVNPVGGFASIPTLQRP